MSEMSVLFLSIFQSINPDIFSTPAVSVPADQKSAQTLFTSTLDTPISTPAVPQAITNIQVLCVNYSPSLHYYYWIRGVVICRQSC